MKKIMLFAAAMTLSAAMYANTSEAVTETANPAEEATVVTEEAAAVMEEAAAVQHKAQASEEPAIKSPAAPELEFVVQLHVLLGQAYSVGKTTHGTRTIIPITGGTFQGPDIKGEVLPGGADYQMADAVTGHTEVEAIYCVRTDDGVTIHVRNNGIINMGKDGMYFTCAPRFEAPADSKYSWLNNKLFVCRPDFSGTGGGITLNVWMIK